MLLMTVGIGLLAVLDFLRFRQNRAGAERPELAASELLRQRYARGELTRKEYRGSLVDMLADRYAQGEIDLGEYEARLAHLVGEQSDGAAGQEFPTGPSTTTVGRRPT